MLIHEKVVPCRTAFPLCAYLGRIAAPVTFLFPNYGKKRHSVCSKKNRMKMSADQEDVFGQRSNHNARS